jgi:hypothetical protein
LRAPWLPGISESGHARALDHYVWQPPTRTFTPPAFALDPGSVTLDDDDDVAPTDRWKYDLY